MFPNGTVERFDVSHWYCGEIRRFTLVLWRDSTFHTGTVERFDVSQWYCGEIRRESMLRHSGLASACRADIASSISVDSIICLEYRVRVFFFLFPRLLIQQQNHRLYFDPFCSPYLKQTVTEGITTSNGGQQRVKPIQYFVSRYLYYNIPFLGQ